MRPTGSAANLLASAAVPVLLRFEPERAHELALRGLRFIRRAWPTPQMPANFEVELLGLRFAHVVGLAAGFDKDGDYLDALGALGFSHIEVGTVTPRPQAGNSPPRLFRARRARALINRMGFNSKGAEHVAAQLARSQFGGIRGLSIGKNADTPLERAVDDYLECLRVLYSGADYFAINVSSPNTQRLRELQEAQALAGIIEPLQEERARLAARCGKMVPLLVKLSPDLAPDELDELCVEILRLRLDGVIATNTTTHTHGFEQLLPGDFGGGLSGEPLREKSLEMIHRLRQRLGPQLPIIGVGGIMDGNAALARLAAGANLIQLYTGFVYRGPALLSEILHAIAHAPLTSAGTSHAR
jgi:dihydroorotate dehydrogenase